MTRIRMAQTAATLLLVTILLSGCGGDDGLEAGAGGGDEVAAESAMSGGDGGLAERGSAPSAVGGSAVPSISEAIIKTAELEIEVDKGQLDEVVRDTELLASRFGGFVFSTSITDYGARTGSVVIRVPSEDFEATKQAIAAEGKVMQDSTSGKDVSQEFIDLEARLRHLEAQEAVMLGLMRDANSIPHSIRVQHELGDVQLEIERITGRIRFLEDRTALATIAVDFVEAGAPVPKEASTLGRAWKLALDVALGLVSAAIISLGVVVPVGVALLIGLLIFRQLRPRLSGSQVNP